MPVVSLRSKYDIDTKQMVQKGPATDYSMLLQMKRRSLIVAEVDGRKDANGRKGTGLVVDNPKQRGSTEGAIVPVYYVRGARLGFFKF